MFGGRNSPKESDDGDDMPQLKFKVPNFFGSLTERRRPAFAADDRNNETSLEEKRAVVDCSKISQSSNFTEPLTENESFQNAETKLNHQERAQHKPIAFPNLSQQEMPHSGSIMHPQLGSELPVSIKDIKEHKEEHRQTNDVTPLKPMNLFKQVRAAHANPLDQAAHTSFIVEPETRTCQQNFVTNEPPQAPVRSNIAYDNTQHKSSCFNYSIEADSCLNQIVGHLAHFRSLGKRATDMTIQLETQLIIERDNVAQYKSLVDLERQAKLMVQEELQSTRNSISTLSERISKLQQAKNDLERDRVMIENTKMSMEKEIQSSKVDYELQKGELESAQTNIQDLERSLISLTAEKSELDAKYCKHTADLQENNVRISKELKMTLQRLQDVQDSHAKEAEKWKLSDAELNDKLESLTRELISPLEEFLPTMFKLLDVERPASCVEDQLRTLSNLIEQKMVRENKSELEMQAILSELKTGLEQKEAALKQCQLEIDNLESSLMSKEEQLNSVKKTTEGERMLHKSEYEAMRLKIAELEKHSQASLDFQKLTTTIQELADSKDTIEEAQEAELKLRELFSTLKSSETLSGSRVRELESQLEQQKSDFKKAFETEKSCWELEKHRLTSDRLKLIQEMEVYKRSSPVVNEKRTPVPPSTNETSTESIVRAIEADLMKSKNMACATTQLEDSWTVSDNIKSPSKRMAPSRPSSRKKRANAGKAFSRDDSIRESPLKSHNLASELDFWALAK